MKKSILLFSLCSALLTACSTETSEPSLIAEDNAIAIDAFAPKMQKSTDATTQSLSAGINVYAYKSGEPYTDSPFMNGVTFEKKDQFWTSTPLTYYWPDYPLDFFGFYPVSLKPSEVNNPEKFNYTVNPDAEKEADIVTSFMGKQEREVVQMQYHHALSKISFVITSAANSGLNISVSSIAITDIPMNGDFLFNKSADVVPNFFTVSNQSQPDTAFIKMAAPVIVKGSDTNISSKTVSGLYLIPHTLKSWKYSDSKAFPMTGSYIRINGALSGVTDYTGNIAIPITTVKWQPGFHYTYNIVFGNAGGSTGGGGYNPDKGADGNTKPEQILMPIQVNVSVDQWIDIKPDPSVDL